MVLLLQVSSTCDGAVDVLVWRSGIIVITNEVVEELPQLTKEKGIYRTHNFRC